MSQAFFVTGTDTEVGKTTIAAGLLHAARAAGLSTAAAKPVGSGCELTPQGLRNSDALALLGESTVALRYEQVNPFAFAPAIAPHLAAREAGVELSVGALAEPVRQVLALGADFTGRRRGRLAGAAGGYEQLVRPGHRPAVAGDSGGRRPPGVHQPCAAQCRSYRT